MTDPLALQGLRVLVVEDEMMVSMLLEDMLADLGCLVVGPAARLDEAMMLADSQPFAYATGYGEASLRAQDRGAIILMKPFRESDLVRVLTEMSERRKP